MKSDGYQPVVEAQGEQPSAVIFSGIRGLGYFLAQELLNHDLSLAFVNMKQTPLGSVLAVSQHDLESLNNLESFVGDYVFCLLPSARPSSSFLDPLLALCRQRQSKLLVVEFYDSIGQKIASHLNLFASDLDYRLVYISQAYGEFIEPASPDPFAKLLVGAVRNRRLVLSQETKKIFYPTHYQDIAQGLVSAMFKGTTIGKTYLLSTLEEVGTTNFAMAIKQSIGEAGKPEPEIDYRLESPAGTDLNTQLVAFSQADLGWYPTVELSQGLRQMMRNLVDELRELNLGEIISPSALDEPFTETESETIPEKEKVISLPNPKPVFTVAQLKPLGKEKTKLGVSSPSPAILPPLSPSRGRQRVKVLALALAVFALITLPVASFVYASWHGVTQLDASLNSLKAGETGTAQIQAKKAQSTLKATRTILNLIRPLTFMAPTYPEKYDRLLDSASRIAGIVSLSGQTLDELNKLYHYLLVGEPAIDAQSSIALAKTNLEELYNQNALVIASLDRIEFDSRLEFFNQLSQLKRSLPQLQQTLETGSSLLGALPELMAGESKNILVVVQNSAELRPTGGFIDGVVLLTLRQGRLVNSEYQDVFALDKQLQGFVEPPAVIKKYLGETGWFLRDANWDPDWAKSAQQIKWFYEKETGTTIDGVIGLNLYSLQNFLEPLGTVTLPESKETISAANLFDKIISLTKANSAAGTVDSPPSLDLMKALMNQLTASAIPLPAIAAALSQNLAQNQLQFYFVDAEAQAAIKKLNWDGSLEQKPCYSLFARVSCVSETFALNEANLGINKVNLFVDRVINQEVKIDAKGRIEHQLEVSYRNASTTTAWPGGDYKAFLRFYAPLGSQLTQLTLNSVAIGVEETKVASPGLEEFSFPILVRPGETASLKLTLVSPNVLNTLSESSALTINWEKQSGLPSVPLKLSITYPQSLTPEAVNLTTNNSPGQVQFLAQLAKDETLAIWFKRK